MLHETGPWCLLGAPPDFDWGFQVPADVFMSLPVSSAAGVLWDPEGTAWQLAVPDLRAGNPPAVCAVPAEGRRHEGNAGRD